MSANPVHLVVIPKKEIPTLDDLTPADEPLIGHLFVVARQLAAAGARVWLLARNASTLAASLAAIEKELAAFDRTLQQLQAQYAVITARRR